MLHSLLVVFKVLCKNYEAVFQIANEIIQGLKGETDEDKNLHNLVNEIDDEEA